jgi:hypothetical protein
MRTGIAQDLIDYGQFSESHLFLGKPLMVETTISPAIAGCSWWPFSLSDIAAYLFQTAPAAEPKTEARSRFGAPASRP